MCLVADGEGAYNNSNVGDRLLDRNALKKISMKDAKKRRKDKTSYTMKE